MKVKVLNRFKDKYTGEIHKVDDVLTISKERYEEILTVGQLVEAIPARKKKTEDVEE